MNSDMAFINISDKDFSIIINEMENEIENVEPISYLKVFHIQSITPVLIHMIEKLFGFCPQSWFTHIRSVAEEIAEKQIKELKEIVLPSQIYEILERDLYKKEQIKRLKDITISPLLLGAIIIQAGMKEYKLSNYCFKGKPKKYKEDELPSFIFLKDDGNLDTYGFTSLTEGQLREYVTNSKYILARFLDNGKHWHCFYQTKKGIQGKECGYLGTQPHIHYISDSFGVSREDFVKALKGGKVPSKVHILLK